MVICLERGVDLHMAQLMPLPLTVSCFSKIQIDFTFLVPAHLGSPGSPVKRVCVCVYVGRCPRNSKMPGSFTYSRGKATGQSATTIVGYPCYPSLAKSWPVSFSTGSCSMSMTIPESQCGFRGGRSTMDMIFTAL